MNAAQLRQAPFHLDPVATAWVRRTFAALTPRQKIGQLLVPLCLDTSRVNLDSVLAAGVGGVFRFHHQPLKKLRADADYLQRHSAVPLLLCGDLEFAEDGAIGGADGTTFPNQMAVAATAAPRQAARMAAIAAREGLAAGYNWALTPVVDLNTNFLSPIVNTRSFGDDPRRVGTLARAYIRELEAAGMAACAKHWPGDGTDDRDQHLVTSVNRCDWKTWQATFGKIYRDLIRTGVRTIMSAHIALPAYRGAGAVPACLSRELNLDLLRGQLGFNGLIVSDATHMAGLTSQGRRADYLPRMVEHGCDVVLFPEDAVRDGDLLEQALADGRLSAARLDDAVLRVLALKASLGLTRPVRLPQPLSRTRRQEHAAWSRACAEGAVTLVQDTQQLLPLSPARHRRVLLITPPVRKNLIHPLPALQLDRLLAAEGFAVERYTPETPVDPAHHDVIVYAVAEEAHLCKGTLQLRWEELHGNFLRGMERHWHEVPTVFISLGSPYHVREVPTCPTYVNAYSPVPDVQAAVVAALVGKIPFAGKSPVRLDQP